MVPEILKDEYRFSQSGVYFSPPESNMAAVNTYFETLPLTVVVVIVIIIVFVLLVKYMFL